MPNHKHPQSTFGRSTRLLMGVVAILHVLCFAHTGVDAQEADVARPEDKSKPSEAKKLDPFGNQRRVVEAIKVSYKDKPTKLLPGPLYTYEEVIHKWHDGTSWAWGTGKGRPVAFLNMMTLNRTRYYEMISLDEAKVTADFGLATWTPKPVWKLKKLKKTSPPAANRKIRLIQMRALARSFKATQYQNGEIHRLRLLSQPILRFQEESPTTLDGAIFAFLRESDLETILILEAAKEEDGSTVWKFDCSRVSVSEQEVERKGEVVWQVPEISYARAKTNTSAYHIYLRPAWDTEIKKRSE